MTSTGNNEYDKLIVLDNDESGTTVNITIIDSTFNQPGKKYYVLIDDGFVKNIKYNEPIIGIQNDDLSFMLSEYFINFSILNEKKSEKILFTNILKLLFLFYDYRKRQCFKKT
jgi:hypothetical protein